jgi:hypothetical protein
MLKQSETNVLTVEPSNYIISCWGIEGGREHVVGMLASARRKVPRVQCGEGSSEIGVGDRGNQVTSWGSGNRGKNDGRCNNLGHFFKKYRWVFCLRKQSNFLCSLLTFSVIFRRECGDLLILNRRCLCRHVNCRFLVHLPFVTHRPRPSMGHTHIPLELIPPLSFYLTGKRQRISSPNFGSKRL